MRFVLRRMAHAAFLLFGVSILTYLFAACLALWRREVISMRCA